MYKTKDYAEKSTQLNYKAQDRSQTHSNSISRDVIRSAYILALARYASVTIGLLTNVVAARVLGPVDYGMVSLVMSIPLLLWSFSSFKPGVGITRHLVVSQQDNAISEIQRVCKIGYGLDLVTAIIVFAVVVVVASAFRSYLPSEVIRYRWLMIAFAATFPFQSLQGTSEAIMLAWNRVELIAAVSILTKTSILVISVSMLAFGFGVTSVVLGFGFGSAISALGAFFLALRISTSNGIPHWWRTSVKVSGMFRDELFHYFSWNYVIVSLSGVATQAPVLLLGHVGSPADAGYFRLSTSLMTSGHMLANSVGSALFPTMVRINVTNADSRERRQYWRWTKWFGLPLAAILALVAIFILPTFIRLLYGESYSAMATGAQALMLVSAVKVLFFWNVPFYYASNWLREFVLIYSFTVLFMLLFGMYESSVHGFIGMALTYALSHICFICVLSGRVLFGRR